MKSIQKKCMLLAIAALPGMSLAGELPNIEGMSGLQFNFSAPGARSLAMGGAFIGRADDSTAAFANPGGLTKLFSTEIAAEYRFIGYDTPYTSGGVYPADIGRPTANSDVNNLSYLSLVFPTDNWVFAFYRLEFMDFKSHFTSESVALPDGFSTYTSDNSVDVNIVNYGFSTAYRVSDRFSIGAGISYYDYKMDASTFRGLPGDDLLNSNQHEQGNDNSWGFILGALFKVTEKLSVGAVYRSTPEFNTTHDQAFPSLPDFDFNTPYKFDPPDAYGIGLSFQPNDNLTINFDIMRITYSDLADPVFWAFSNPAPTEGQDIVNDMSIDDGTEFHLGAEYVLQDKPIALRAGVWHDPDHVLAYNNADPQNVNEANTFAYFPPGSSETHWSVGFGFYFEKFQMDFAADFSKNQDTISISGVYRFE